ncbi:hypothetical protein HYC85_005109 [Camellia sinensis]|uniref:Uncharacterized protein n=1 Tax=Camellia sinensis TaxID=4442 RepID=A0A7J7I0E4_CAMSI|nr:hypothetical protein HYC85_005109 [Camellia sinensis]
MAFVQSTNVNSTILCKKEVISQVGILSIPFSQPRATTIQGFLRENVDCQSLSTKETTLFPRKRFYNLISKKVILTTPRSSSPSNSNGSKDESSDQAKAFFVPVLHLLCYVLVVLACKTPFGYTRKDVLLIGLGVTLAGIGLKSGLEFFGVDPLQAGNVVQLVLVLGLTVGWISTYIFRVSNKEMTYAQQLRDYESKVMEKRLEGLTEAELEALLEQVEEEKRRLASGEQIN